MRIPGSISRSLLKSLWARGLLPLGLCCNQVRSVSELSHVKAFVAHRVHRQTQRCPSPVPPIECLWLASRRVAVVPGTMAWLSSDKSPRLTHASKSSGGHASNSSSALDIHRYRCELPARSKVTRTWRGYLRPLPDDCWTGALVDNRINCYPKGRRA